ncbi:hypothetical protein [Flavobacterium sp.]|uniref:hypothetical protein n=1 Tax=Flavobacterium sp. TaxID=239 RepID=UPI00261421A1|nr:hypothetical protein [Flavobacterium sp.]
MLNHKIKLVASFLACILCSCSDKVSVNENLPTPKLETSSQAASKSHASLISEIEAANSTCRDKPGMSKESVDACDKRDQLMIEAENADLCWGPQSAIGADRHWIKCSEDPGYVKPWFSHDLNHAKCIASDSPATRMRSIMDSGKEPKVLDLPNGAVEVQNDIGNGKTVVWTFYRSMDLCVKSLPRSKSIDKKYE